MRWKVWGLPKLPVLFSCYLYIVLRLGLLGLDYVIDFFLLVVLLSSYMAFGHLVNDYSDWEADRLAGKMRLLSRLPLRTARIIVTGSLVVTVLATVPFVTRPLFAVLFSSSLFLATFYSLKPLRLKETGVGGLVTIALSVELLPLLLVFSVLSHFDPVDISLFAAFYVSWGLKEIAKHQWQDWEHDAKASVSTFAVKRGPALTLNIYRWFYVAERVFLTLLLIWVVVQLPLTVFAILGYFVVGGYRLLRAGEFTIWPSEPVHEGQTLVHLYPRIVLPFYLLVPILLYSPYFLALLLFLVVWEAKLVLWLLPAWARRAVLGGP